MIKFFSLLLLVFPPFIASAQKQTTIIYNFKRDSATKAVAYDIISPLQYYHNDFGEPEFYKRKIISNTIKNDSCQVICQYAFKDTTCVFFFSGFGLESFIIPGDTIVMNIGKRNIREIRNGYIRPWSNDITFEGGNKYKYCLFDSLYSVAGAVNFGSDIKLNANVSLSDFLLKVSEQYQMRHSYLKNYCKNHYINQSLEDLAGCEIYSSYIKSLLFPIIFGKANLKDYPENYRKVLIDNNFNDRELYFKTNQYYLAAYLSVINDYYMQSGVSNNTFSKHFIKEYDFIKKSKHDKNIKNHLLTQYMNNCLLVVKDSLRSFDSLFNDFKKTCTNASYVRYADSLYQIKKAEVPKVYSFKDALSTDIKNNNELPFKVEDLFHNKPLIIICWASWCIPCIKELPDEQMLEKRYGNKVDFVYLSFDRNQSKWKQKEADLKIGSRSYLLNKGFKSDFSSFYNINSIPRYLVYDRNRKLIDIKDIRPSNHEAFKYIINQLIKSDDKTGTLAQ